MTRPRNSNGGFSLVELLVAAGMLCILGLVSATLISNLVKQEARMDSFQNSIALTDEIRRSIESPTLCQQNLVNAESAGKQKFVASINNLNEVKIKLSDSNMVRAGIDLPIYKIRIDSLKLKLTDTTPIAPNTYRATLLANYSPLVNLPGFQTKPIGPVILTTDGANNITACSGGGTAQLTTGGTIGNDALTGRECPTYEGSFSFGPKIAPSVSVYMGGGGTPKLGPPSAEGAVMEGGDGKGTDATCRYLCVNSKWARISCAAPLNTSNADGNGGY